MKVCCVVCGCLNGWCVWLQAGGDTQPPVGLGSSAVGGGGGAAAPPDPSSALLHSLRAWRDASRTAAAAAAAPPAAPSRRGAGGAAGAAAPDAATAAIAADAAEGAEALTLGGFRLMLGPELRVAWFPFLQISLAAPQLQLSGPAVPERLQVRLASSPFQTALPPANRATLNAMLPQPPLPSHCIYLGIAEINTM